jgi:hypothetical protein
MFAHKNLIGIGYSIAYGFNHGADANFEYEVGITNYEVSSR